MKCSNEQWVRTLSAAALSLGLSVPVFAVDISNTSDVSADRSRNPLTGTVTDTRKVKKHKHNRNGSRSDVNVTEKVKTRTDGSQEKTVESDVSTEPAK